MEQGRKSLGEIFISGTEREPLPLVAPVLYHCSTSSSSSWSVCRALLLLCGCASVIFIRASILSSGHTLYRATHVITAPACCETLEFVNCFGNYFIFLSINVKYLIVSESYMWEFLVFPQLPQRGSINYIFPLDLYDLIYLGYEHLSLLSLYGPNDYSISLAD